jgi:hypothetical protein
MVEAWTDKHNGLLNWKSIKIQTIRIIPAKDDLVSGRVKKAEVNGDVCARKGCEPEAVRYAEQQQRQDGHHEAKPARPGNLFAKSIKYQTGHERDN